MVFALASWDNGCVQIYLDHAATTPMYPEAIAEWARVAALVGNPSSLHADGRAARRVVEESREKVASLLGAKPAEVLFTAGGTEADNLAVVGLARGSQATDPARRRVLVSAVEHHAVLEAARTLRAEGFEVIEVPVDHAGVVDITTVRNAFETDAKSICLVSCMWVNNEVGTIQPVYEIQALADWYNVPLHVDAVQAIAHIESGFGNFDALSLSAHKIGGPVGVGALLARRSLPIQPIGYGGGQERKLRSGTIPTALIASFALALERTIRDRETEIKRLQELSTRLIEGIKNLGYDVAGPQDPELRTPGIVYTLFEDADAEALLMLLDAAGFSVSTGAACTAGVVQPSDVLLAMGYSEQSARSGLRFSLGWTTTEADIAALLDFLPHAVKRAIAAGIPTAPSAAGTYSDPIDRLPHPDDVLRSINVAAIVPGAAQ
jgi:cysteine desulfurase